MITWIPANGPYKNEEVSLTIDHNNRDIIYVVTNGSGVFKSNNGGASWKAINEGLTNLDVQTLAIAPDDSNNLYVGTNGSGVFESSDGGASWRAINTGMPAGIVQFIAFDPQDSDVLYTGMYGSGVFTSNDAGASWKAINKGLPNLDVQALAIALDDSNNLYVGTNGSGVFESSDGGASWKAIEGLTGLNVKALALDYQDSSILYAATTSSGVFKSSDGGASWRMVNGSLTDLNVHTLALDPQNSDILYIGTYGSGVFESSDGGTTGRAINEGLTADKIRFLVIAPYDSSMLYVGTYGSGVFESSDGGTSWKAISESLTDLVLNSVSLASDLGVGSILYAGTDGSGVFKSNDGGVSWRAISQGFTDLSNIQTLTLDPQDSNILYAGTYRGRIFKSKDGGVNWTAIDEGLLKSTQDSTEPRVQALALDSQNSNILYAGIYGHGVFKSDDGGMSWKALNEELTQWCADHSSFELCSVLYVQALTLAPQDTGTLYIGTNGGGVFKSSDGGASWKAINEGLTDLNVKVLAPDHQDSSILYAGTDGGAVFKSTDGGMTWEPKFSGSVLSIIIIIINDSQVICVGTPRGTFTSVDGGTTWRNAGLSDVSINEFALGPKSGGGRTLYAGTTRGVYRGVLDLSKLHPPWWQGNAALAAIVSSFAIIIVTFSYLFVARPNQIPFPTALSLFFNPRQLVLAAGGGYVERSWLQWQRSVESNILRQSRVTAQALADIPRPFRDYALQRYHQERQEEDLSLEKDGLSLRSSARTRSWLEASEKAVAVLGGDDAQQRKEFGQQAAALVQVLSDALGLVQLESRSYRRMQGYVVEAPALRLRVPPRFPVIFPQCTTYSEEDIVHLADFMGVLGMTDYFALLVAFDWLVDGRNVTGLRRLVKGSPYAHDFIVLGNDDVLSILKARAPNARLIQILLDQVDLSLVSPYVTDGPVPENMYFGRENEIKTITQTIKDNDFALAGGRKIGKTSTLQKVHRLLDKDPRYSTLYLDCQPITTYEEFFDTLGRKLEHELDAAPASFRDVVTWLKQEAGDRLVVVLFDEVDNLLTCDVERGERLFKVFRSVSQEGYCRFIFCGGKSLHRRIHHPDSPFFNFCKDIILGHLDEKNAVEIITRPMDDMGIELQGKDHLVAQIIEISSCHPNLVQFICERLIKHIQVRRVTLEDLHAVTNTQEFYQYFIETTWGQSTPLEKIITLTMLDHQGFTRGEVYATLERRGIEDKAAIDEALETLQLYTLLRQEGKNYFYALAEFPRIVRESEDVEALIESLLGRV